MWISTRVEEKLAQLDEKVWSEQDAYQNALNDVISEDEGRTWAQGMLHRYANSCGQMLTRPLQATSGWAITFSLSTLILACPRIVYSIVLANLNKLHNVESCSMPPES